MGLRGKELHYAHNQFFSVLHNSVIGVRDIIVRDENLRPNSKRAAKLRENTVMFDEMTPHLIMMGFPTVKWIDIALFAVGLPSEVDQNSSMFYIDAMEHLGLPADVCPEPAAESGCAVVDDYPRVGKCYFTSSMPSASLAILGSANAAATTVSSSLPVGTMMLAFSLPPTCTAIWVVAAMVLLSS